MARRIEGTIYRLTYTATWHDYVECSSKEDLFKYVAQEVANGQIVTSVNEMCKESLRHQKKPKPLCRAQRGWLATSAVMQEIMEQSQRKIISHV